MQVGGQVWLADQLSTEEGPPVQRRGLFHAKIAYPAMKYLIAKKYVRAVFVMALTLCFLAFSHADILFAAAPTVMTGAASSITTAAAVLNGEMVSDGGSAITAVGFDYGTTTSYGSSAASTLNDYVFDQNIGVGSLSNPQRVVVDSTGNIFVSDQNNHVVRKYDPDGNALLVIGTVGVASGTDGQLDNPVGLAIDSSDNVYIADGGGFSTRIQKFSNSGSHLLTFNVNNLFDNLLDIAVASNGNIYVARDGADMVDIYNSAGVSQTFFTTGLGLRGIAIDENDNLYAAIWGTDQVEVYNLAGTLQTQFGSNGTGNGQFNNPNDIAFDSLGGVYVSDSNNRRVQKFNSSNVYVSQYGTAGAGNGQFGASSPIGVAVSGGANIYAVNNAGNRIIKFTGYLNPTSISSLTCDTAYHFRAFATNADGTSYGNDATFTTSACDVPTIETKDAARIGKKSVVLNGLESDDGVAASTVRGFEYGTSTSYGTRINLSPTSLSQSTIGSAGTGDIEFSGATGLAQDFDGNVYVADTGNNRIQVLDSSGTLIRMFGWGVATGADAFEVCTSGCQAGAVAGTEDGRFDAPEGVAVNAITHDIYVSDTGNDRIQVFSSDGLYQSKFGTTGSGAGQFDAPKAIVVINGTIYVLDSANLRVQKLNSSGVMLDEIGSAIFTTPSGLTGNTEHLFLTDMGTAKVYSIDRVTMDATEINFIEPSGWIGLAAPNGITIDDNNNLYISDIAHPAILFAVREADESHYRFITSYGTLLGNPAQLFVDGSILRVADPGNSNIAVLSPFMSYELKPLQCNTTYHYRAFATNSDGTDTGADQTFTTLSDCGTLSGGGGGQIDPPAGCTDPTADNYDSVYVVDDGSCYFLGCIDNTASNYDPTATVDDGSCISGPPPTPGCTNSLATNYNAAATVDDGSCVIPGGGPTDPVDVFGCTDTFANNYNPNATIDDGVSCEYSLTPIMGCMIPAALNYNPNATVSDGLCNYPPPWLPPVITEIIDIISDVTGWTPQEQADVYTDVAVAGLVVPSIWFLLANRTALVSIPLRLWNLIPTLLGFRRKRRPWGTVYDSVTKQPLDPVYVRLYDSAYAEAATSITDLDGRYGFAPAPGTYTMDAKKGDYVFPSVKLKDATHDELYDDLYFGGTLDIDDEDSIITKNIPMDAINFNWNEFEKAKRTGLMKFYSKGELFLSRIAKILFIAGFAASFLLVFLEPRLFNYIILGVYVLISVLSLFGVRPRRPGFVVERATGAPLSFAILSVFSELLKKEVAHTIVGATGRYHVLVPKGRYYVTLKKKTGEQTYKDIYTSDVFRARKGYIDQVFKI